VQDADEQLRLLPAAIEAEDELVEVALEVLRADGMEGSAEPDLQVPEDRVCPGQQRDGLASVTPLCGR
jgi:hypothetical protein